MAQSKTDTRSAIISRIIWENEQPDPTKTLIDQTFEEWYAAKHRRICESEVSFINSYIPECCPKCGRIKIVKNGKTSNGIQRYQCKDCGTRFLPTTGTIFDAKKIPVSEWMEYILHLCQFDSIRSTTKSNRNAPDTGLYWLRKVFLVLDGIQDDVVLDGEVYIDEKYFPKKEGDLSIKDGKKLRGISANQIGVATGKVNGGSFLIVTNASKLSNAKAIECYGPHIQDGATIIHDAEKAHNALVKAKNLKSIVYPSAEAKKNPDLLAPINKYHSLLARFMREHSGFDRGHLQDWMNLFWFITNGPENHFEKVAWFMDMAMKKKVTLRYRDRYNSVHSE